MILNRKNLILITTLCFVAGLLVYFKIVMAVSIFPIRQINVEIKANIESVPTGNIGWNFESKIKEARELLKNIDLKVGDRDVEYIEKRISIFDGSIKVSDKKLKDAERQIGLVLLNKNSGRLDRIVITKKGAELISPSGYLIEIIERQNGIRWNYWATEFKVIQPTNTMVLLDKWPEKEAVKEKKIVTAKNGRKSTIYQNVETVNYTIYAPYSENYHVPEMIALGDKYIRTMVADAFAKLRVNGVYSRAYKDKFISDVIVLKSDFFSKIPITEHSDLGEFVINPQKTSERVKIIIAANGGEAYTQTCNLASACGWVQYTPRTYKEIAKTYPRAKLISDFKTGAADHLNSMMAAILLYDYNLAGLIRTHGPQIASDPRLEEYLAAAYNGAPSRVNQSLKASITSNLPDWVGKLLPETKGYLAKIRFLQRFD